MLGTIPDFLDPTPWLPLINAASTTDVRRALACEEPGEAELAALLSVSAIPLLEDMARRAQALTQRHFGRTVSLYIPLYLSDYCSGGCEYCGFAADRRQLRRRLEPGDIIRELDAIKAMGFDEILLLTGERTPQADLEYLREAVRQAAQRFAAVTIESFPMKTEEYRILAEAGAVVMAAPLAIKSIMDTVWLPPFATARVLPSLERQTPRGLDSGVFISSPLPIVSRS
ncbi:MAG: radical SAM protein, partial [bacterium]